MAEFEVHSFGRCFKNKAFHESKNAKTNIFSNYLFAYVPENNICKYYHSEKFYDAVSARTVPIYLGANTILDPPYLTSSFVDASNSERMISDIKFLMSNKKAYTTIIDNQRKLTWANPTDCNWCLQLRKAYLQRTAEPQPQC